ncbi:MAG: nucleoside hydrolase [Caldilineaceae bacterium]|nr:nucleoside hydrolase [Caldilineaceae bacterium]
MIRLIMDTDPGVDDAMAILFGLRSPEVQIEALTTVFGNGGVARTTENALKILEVGGRGDIPVVPGAAKPLLHAYHGKGSTVHGADGLGNTNLPAAKGQPLNARAAEYIVQQVMGAPGEITLLAVGPLTNLALAVSLEPAIAHNVKQVVIMGGAVDHRGNASPLAEANIHNDAAAAKIVFHAGWPLTMLGLNVTHQTVMTTAYVEQLKTADTPVTNFICAISQFYLNAYRTRDGIDGFFVHDSSAMAYVVDPTLFQSQKVYVDVQVGDARANGQTMADWRNQWGQPPNVNVCTKVDADRFLKLYQSRIM